MSKNLVLVSTVACFTLGGYLLLSSQETAGMTFILAGCLGVLAYSTEA